jgi:hypothetical protein
MAGRGGGERPDIGIRQLPPEAVLYFAISPAADRYRIAIYSAGCYMFYFLMIILMPIIHKRIVIYIPVLLITPIYGFDVNHNIYTIMAISTTNEMNAKIFA